jgi:predicted nucleic acid-binding protein
MSLLTVMQCGGLARVYLVDTSVLTRLRKPGIAEKLLVLDDVRYSPISALEYRYSASNETEWQLLTQVLTGFARDPFPTGTFDRADEVQRLLAAQGLKGRKPPDLMIAAHAELAGLTVVHYDHDFDHIATVTGQKTLWINPPGTHD